MPSYCTTTDVSVFYEDFGSLTGTLGTTIIEAASEWVQATLLDSYGQIFPDSGTNYPFWVKKATALESIYLGMHRRMDQGQTSSTGFWTKYHDQALEILQGIKDGVHVIQSQDTAEWERGICPAVGTANGTITAPGYGYCFSNADVPNQWFTGEYPITYVLEIDGTGSTIAQQTFRWQPKYGSVWSDEKVALSWGWTALENGAYVRWVDFGTFVTGQRWEVACMPNQSRTGKGIGASSFQLVMVR
jgi:hypothetical protein